MISHNTTNFQGRKNFSFTSEADPGDGPPPRPVLFLDQTEARKVGKIFLETGPSPLSKDLDDRSPPSPYLKVWIRHCTYLTSKPSRPKQPRRRFRMNEPKIKYSGVDGFTYNVFFVSRIWRQNASLGFLTFSHLGNRAEISHMKPRLDCE